MRKQKQRKNEMELKKLMIVAAAAMMAFVSQAATANWKVTAGNIFDSSGASTKYAGSAYVFDAGVLAMASLYAAYEADRSYDFAANAAGSVTIANGAIASSGNSFSYGESGSTYDFYMVVVDGDNIYFSNQKDNLSALNPPSVGAVGFSTQNNGSTTFSGTAPSGTGFQGAGKWSNAPEPTSGLLFLLGAAGLALRRRQA